VQHRGCDGHRELRGLGRHLVPHVGARRHHDPERRRGGAAGGEGLEERMALGRRRHRDQLLRLVDDDEDLGVGRALAGLTELPDEVGHAARLGQQLLAAVDVDLGALQLGRVREGERHLGQRSVGGGPGIGDHPLRSDPEGGHQAGADEGGLPTAGGAEHRDDHPVAAAAGRVDELAQLVDLAVPPEEDRGIGLVEGPQPGERRTRRVPARLLVETKTHQRRAHPLAVDRVGGDLQPLEVLRQRVRRAAVDEQRQDRLAQPPRQCQLRVAPLAGV
jgi:hypothetical protein